MLQSTYRHDLRSAYPGEYKPDYRFLSNQLEETLSQKSIDIEIFEDDHYFKIEFAVPGLSRENLLVKINEKGNLLIKGFKRNEHNSIIGRSNNVSGFKREFALPKNIDTDFVKAEFREGVLTLCFLKTTENYQKRPSIVAVY